MVSVIIYLRADISSEISEKLNDQEFVQKIANVIKPAYVIFDSNGKVLHNDGCEDFLQLDGIKIDRVKSQLHSITIPTKKYLEIPPIVTSIDAEMYFRQAKRTGTYEWQFDAVELNYAYFGKPDGGVPAGRFRLEIIR